MRAEVDLQQSKWNLSLGASLTYLHKPLQGSVLNFVFLDVFYSFLLKWTPKPNHLRLPPKSGTALYWICFFQKRLICVRHLDQCPWSNPVTAWKGRSQYTCCFQYPRPASFISDSPQWPLYGVFYQQQSWSMLSIHLGRPVKMTLHKIFLWILSLSVDQCFPSGGDLAVLGAFGKVWRPLFDRHDWEGAIGI